MNSRLSFYREVHKGIRSFLFDLVVRAGRIDWTDAEEVDDYRLRASAAFALLDAHAAKEDHFVAPLLEKADAEIATILGGHHVSHGEDIEVLRLRLAAIDPGSATASASGHAFLLSLSRFAGESLIHMSDEEEIAMPAMWRAFDDSRLVEAHQTLVKSIAPAEMAAFLRWMLPALTDAERVELLAGIRVGAPAPVFDTILRLAEEVLSAAQHRALENALEEVQHA